MGMTRFFDFLRRLFDETFPDFDCFFSIMVMEATGTYFSALAS